MFLRCEVCGSARKSLAPQVPSFQASAMVFVRVCLPAGCSEPEFGEPGWGNHPGEPGQFVLKPNTTMPSSEFRFFFVPSLIALKTCCVELPPSLVKSRNAAFRTVLHPCIRFAACLGLGATCWGNRTGGKRRGGGAKLVTEEWGAAGWRQRRGAHGWR